MKKTSIICIFTLTTLLLGGCTQNNNPGSETSSGPDFAFSSSATTEEMQPVSRIPAHTSEEEGITPEAARQRALERVPGATAEDIREFEPEYNDGKLIYEGKIYYEQTEYEFEIDAESGAVLEWDVEPIYGGNRK